MYKKFMVHSYLTDLNGGFIPSGWSPPWLVSPGAGGACGPVGRRPTHGRLAGAETRSPRGGRCIRMVKP